MAVSASHVITVNADLRTMNIPAAMTLLGVESDDDVNEIMFVLPRYYENVDLSTFEARVNYMNANGDGDVYVADDLEIEQTPEGSTNNLTFTWMVGRNACAYVGDTKFIVCLKKFDSNSNVVQEFNSTVYSLPVLEGLETTEAVVQQNPDVIEQILQMIQEAGVIDPNNYYTKAQTDSAIANAMPTALPNPEKLTVNGTEYDGSVAVDLNIMANTVATATAAGKIVHVDDAVADQAMDSLTLYDSGGNVLSNVSVAVANKNLFRLDLISDSLSSKGITFVKNADGSITASGTSTGTYPATQCNLDKNIFVVGKTYTISTGKTSGYLYVQLILNYTDGSTDYIVARNSARSFTLQKAVSSATGSVQITDSGVTLTNEVIYPQLELSDTASAFAMNTYSEVTFTGSTMPVLPASISNVWSNSDTVDDIVMEYEADIVASSVNAYMKENYESNVASLAVTHDGNGTVTIALG